MYVLEWPILWSHERVILVFIARVVQQRENEHQNNAQVSAETVCHENTYINYFYIESIYDDKMMIFTCRLCVTHLIYILQMMSQLMMEVVEIICCGS